MCVYKLISAFAGSMSNSKAVGSIDLSSGVASAHIMSSIKGYKPLVVSKGAFQLTLPIAIYAKLLTLYIKHLLVSPLLQDWKSIQHADLLESLAVGFWIWRNRSQDCSGSEGLVEDPTSIIIKPQRSINYLPTQNVWLRKTLNLPLY